MTKNAVELRSVSFTYAGFDAPAVDDVSFAVAPGECIVLCGESGCGKTTATRIVNGLAGGFYEGSRTGKVLIAGRDVDDLEDWELSSLTGSVFQNPALSSSTSTRPARLRSAWRTSRSQEEMHRRVRDVVRELGIEADGQRHLRALRGPDAIGGLRERMGLQAERLRPRRAFEQSGPSLHGEARLLHLESQVERVCRDHRRAQALLPRSVADRYLLFEGGSVAAEWDAQRFLGLSDAERESCGLRSSEPPKLADLMQRLSRPASAFPAVEARGIYAGYERGAGPRGDYRRVRPREGRRRGRA